MIRFLFTRILSAIPVLFVLSVVTFAIIQRATRGLRRLHQVNADEPGRRKRRGGAAQADAYRAAHGLNDPLPLQYLNWIAGIVTRFDFGHSLFYNRPVSDVVAERLPRTILLALTCHFLASLFGIRSGSSRRRASTAGPTPHFRRCHSSA